MSKTKMSSEHELQKAIIEYLKYYNKYCDNIYWIRNNSFSGQIVRADGSHGWIKNDKKGSPDIVLCKDGLWIGLEIKSKKGRQSPEQKQAELDINKAGGRYFIVRDFKEFEILLNNL